MAAGYISSTSGIGVADPIDAGIYEAQQDALNRIERQEAQREREQAQKAAEAKALIGDLKYEAGYLPEDAEAINSSFREAQKARSASYGLIAKYPNSPQAKQALDDAKAKEAEYKRLWNASKMDNDALIKMTADIKDGDDVEEMKRKIAELRSTDLRKRTPEQRANLFNIKKQPTLGEAVGGIMKDEKEQFDFRQTNAPTKDKVGGREYEVSTEVNMTPEQAFARARTAVSDNERNLLNTGLQQYKNAVKSGTSATIEAEAKQLGFDTKNEKEMAAFFVAKEFLNRQQNDISYKELKLTEPEKEALDFEYKKKEIDYQGQKDAEDGLGFFARVTNINQLNPSYISGVRFVDPRNGQESYFVGQNVGAPIGTYVRKKVEGGKVIEETDYGKPIEAENKIELVITDGKGGLRYTTTESMNDYAQGIIQTPFKPASPEILTDLYLSGKGVNAERLIAAKNNGLKKFKAADGRVDYNKIYSTKQSDREIAAKLSEQPFKPIDGVGGTQPKTKQTQQPAQQQPTPQFKGVPKGGF